MTGKVTFFLKMVILCGTGATVSVSPLAATAFGQTTSQTTASVGRRMGTVQSITGNGFVLSTDDGQQIVVTVQDGARMLQLAPGSKDLKSAQPIALKDIAVGDRVLVSGKSSDDTRTFGAMLVVLMKAGDIAEKHTTEQADWQKRGTGGIVSSVDGGTITVMAGAKKIAVTTTGVTKFRRYAGDSVRFEDAKPGTLSQIMTGDQLRVRGAKSEDGLSIQAEEIVSGSFKNVAGVIATLDTATGKLSLKDLATKKTVVVSVTANTSIHSLPPQVAARFAARSKGVEPASSESNTSNQSVASGSARRSAGMELSDVMSRLPNQTIGDLKTGDAVMIVASQADLGSEAMTAITVLSGVDPILAATPGGPVMTLSPWSVGGADSGGGQ